MSKSDSVEMTDSVAVTLNLPSSVHRILSKQASNMELQLDEFVAGLVDLGYEQLSLDGGARSYL